MTLTKGKPYRFKWNDTYSRNGWHSLEDIEQNTYPMIHESIGYLVKEDKVWYVIAQNKNPEPGFMPWACISWIPKGSVVKVTSLPS